jgi:predicted aminopeptidase
VKDDSTFNESFAVTVEREGVRRWLLASGRGLADWLADEERRRLLVAEIQQTRARLDQLYRSRIAIEAMRERKRRELEALQQKLSGRFKEIVPNNAFLASFATYTELATEFEFILKENDGDLERFYAQVKRYAASAPSNRGPLSKPSP